MHMALMWALLKELSKEEGFLGSVALEAASMLPGLSVQALLGNGGKSSP